VDVKNGGLANAENRIELVEMGGYESPFVSRIHVLDFIRRLKSDTNQLCVTNYIRRRLVAGFIPLSWDSGSKTYSRQDLRAIGSVYAFNNHYEAAPLQSSVDRITELLTYINRYYGFESGEYPSYIDTDRKVFYGAYALALCVEPDALDPHQPEANHVPIVRPTYKHVVKPNEEVYKQIIAMDPDDNSLTVSVSGLPGGASYNSSTRTITWTPGTGDTGVYMVTITADDGTTSKSRPFPIIVKSDAGSGPIPSGPQNLTATLQAGNEVYLDWDAPGGVDVAYYVIYRDGSLHDVVAGTQTDYTDTDALPDRSHTRYHVALYDTNGGESYATGVSPDVPLSVGAHIITLEVTDNDGATDTDTVVVIVNSANTHNWNGAGDGSSWNDPANWVEGAVPATTGDGDGADDVLIDGSYSVHVTADVISIHGLIIGGNAVLTIDPDITLAVQSLDVVNGGLVIDGTGALLKWGKSNRGHLYVESDGYIAGTGTVQTAASTSQGVHLKSTRSADFDMTNITLKMAYQEKFWVCSPDLGRESSSYWLADNFAIGKILLSDGRFNYPLYQADGSIGGGTNALYCMELEFAEKLGEGAHTDLQGINLYVRDKVIWFDDTTAETPGQLTVATAYDPLDVTSSIYDNDVPQGEAWIGYGAAPDTTPPSPDPMTWATEPIATGLYSISMTATTATDESGVEYYFECTAGGGHSSTWQDGTSYEDTGLDPDTTYSYRVKARDNSY